MNVVEPGSPADHLLARVRDLILRPLPTWDEIDQEEATIDGLYRGSVAPLAAVPAVCGAVGALAFGGLSLFGVRFHPNFLGIITEAAVGYALTLLGVFLLALVIDELALRFNGERSRTQAFKLVAFSAAPAWLGGVFLILPAPGGVLSFLAGLYSLYLFYLGLPKLMRSNPDETLTYFALSLITMIGIAVVMGALTSCAGGWGGPVSIY